MSSAVTESTSSAADGGDRMSFKIRLKTRLKRNQLDRELAQGSDPSASAELTFRADQLRSASERARLANALISIVGRARGPNPGPFTRRARQSDDAIWQSADDLVALADRLRTHRPAEVKGVAMVAQLVNDRASALYGGKADELQAAVRAAQAALDESTESAHEDLKAAA